MKTKKNKPVIPTQAGDKPQQLSDKTAEPNAAGKPIAPALPRGAAIVASSASDAAGQTQSVDGIHTRSRESICADGMCALTAGAGQSGAVVRRLTTTKQVGGAVVTSVFADKLVKVLGKVTGKAGAAQVANEARAVVESANVVGRVLEVNQPPPILAYLDQESEARQRLAAAHAAYQQVSPVHQLKNSDPQALLGARALDTDTKPALCGFLARYNRNPWMRDQRGYPQRAALAAAYSSWIPPIFSDSEQTHVIHRLGAFDGIDLLNCGWSHKSKTGGGYFQHCHQPWYCPSCNRWERVEPAKNEFLGAFGTRTWYGITVMARSDPQKAGVKIEIGKDAAGEPIYESLFKLADHHDLIKLPKFGLDHDWVAPFAVADGLFDFALWLTNNRYFDGLHVVGDVKFKLFPDRTAPFEVGNTINCHIHGFGNTSRVIDANLGRRMFAGCLKSLYNSGKGQIYGYPDILLVPAQDVEKLETTINYVFKPFDIVRAYDQAWARGCPPFALNAVFHQYVFGAEYLFRNSAFGLKCGNMTMKSRHRYIGRPPRKEMSEKQVRRYQERDAAGQAGDWEHERYQNHLAILA